jgi:hypothetical protein
VMRREPTHANVADARHDYYFVVGSLGQWPALISLVLADQPN